MKWLKRLLSFSYPRFQASNFPRSPKAETEKKTLQILIWGSISVEEKIAQHEKDGIVVTREIVVQFNVDVADGMPWKFVPTQREVRVKPGEIQNITGVSTYNVTPMKVTVYFNKIQFFCFEEQRLLLREQIDMPISLFIVFFYIDPEFETDARMDGINNLILSYTFFKVSEK
ncbi:hypothetical protein ES319_A01G152000v1 [Gossypium barbadense]|uniref:Uncharacterized protein n=1 Tax=Gossypium barbadense TaxID=3634 RepID=A0A5J5WZB0_GOSBA|nr:hypothetical protein ES319_A01G152000v1 [Gossypium barbadense]